MKKYLLILFILPISLLATSKYNYFEMAYDFIGHKYVNDNEVALIGDANSFIIHNLEKDEFYEYYFENSSSITDITKFESYYYVISNSTLRLYKNDVINPLNNINFNNGDFLIVLVSNSSEITLINKLGKVFYFNIDNNIISEVVDQSIGINPVKLSYKGNHFILQNDNLYRIENNYFTKVYEFDKIERYFDKLYVDDNYFYFSSRFELYKFDKNFQLISKAKDKADYFEIIGNSYFNIGIINNELTIFERSNRQGTDQIINELFLDPGLSIQNITSVYNYKNKIYILGDSKLIVEFDFREQTSEILSAIKKQNGLFYGSIRFFNDSLGYATFNNTMLYLTTNSGSTWKPIIKDSVLNTVDISYGDGFFFPDGSFVIETGIFRPEGKNDLLFKSTSDTSYEWVNYIRTNNNIGNKKRIYFNKERNEIYSFATGFYNTKLYGKQFTTLLQRKNLNNDYSRDTLFHLNSRYLKSFVELDNKFYMLCSSTQTNLDTTDEIVVVMDLEDMSYYDNDFKIDGLFDYDKILKYEENIIISGWVVNQEDDTSRVTYISYNKGEKWEKLEILDNSVIELVYDDNLMTFRNNQIYLSKDKGKTFDSLIVDAIPDLTVVLNFVSTNLDSYYAKDLYSQIFRGFRSKINPVSSVEYETESPSTFYTYRPYPNPANNMVTLPFDFLSSANLTNMEIKLIDVSGRDVSQFADFNIRALNHYKAELEIKLDNIQRGIYFIQMRLNGTSKTSSFIKLN